MNLLEVNNICKTYGSGETAVHALKKVSFSVPKGEYVAIVGESGSGKSTLLNMIGALDTPTSGKVVIGGKEIFSMLKQPNCPFVLFVGTRKLVKRREFEEFIRREIII